MIGLLELPGAALASVDAALAGVLPDVARIVLWGALAGVISMAIYRRTSPQQRLIAVRGELAVAQRALAGYDGPLPGLWPLMRRQFRLALRQMGLSLGPSLLSGLPIILAWPGLAQQFDHVPPEPGSPVRVLIEPANLAQRDLRWLPADVAVGSDGSAAVPWSGGALRLVDREQRELALLPTSGIPVAARPSRWDWLFGASVATLPADGPVEVVHADLEPRRFLPRVPGWLAGWEAWFIAAVLAASLACRRLWRLQ